MLKKGIFFGLVVKFMVAGSDIDSLNLKYMYEGAKEIEMLNRSMEAVMRGHNEIEKPLYVESQESI